MVKINLQELLEKNNRSIYWLAENTGITYGTLHRIVNKPIESIKLEIIEKICLALEVNVEELIIIEKKEG